MKTTQRIFAIFSFSLCLILMPNAGQAQDKSDKAGVKMAVLDYVEGIYEVQPDRIEQSVSPDLAKVGYWWSKEKTTYRESPMSYEQLVDLAGKWNADDRVDAEKARKDIQILDLMDQIAIVKLSAHWGVDYLNLAKIDGKWMIMNVLWQSYPADEQ